jgi:hypothetical protein
MTKLAIIPFTVLLETIFLKKRFRLENSDGVLFLLEQEVRIPVLSAQHSDEK